MIPNVVSVGSDGEKPGHLALVGFQTTIIDDAVSRMMS